MTENANDNSLLGILKMVAEEGLEPPTLCLGALILMRFCVMSLKPVRPVIVGRVADN